MREKKQYDKIFDVLSVYEGNNYIKNTILSGIPHAIGKIGSNELIASRIYLGFKNSKKRRNKYHPLYRDKRTFKYKAGIFPDRDEIYEQFAMVYTEAIKSMDYIAVWRNYEESRVISSLNESAILSQSITSLKPFFFDDPWSEALKEKTVLLVHPFVNSIEAQYEKRKTIWNDEKILPHFHLKTMKVPQNAAVDTPWFADWLETYRHLLNELKGYTFDVAIIGAGAWSIPLVVEAKKMGKIGIHMGGATQLLFGIKGGRWNDREDIRKMYNSSWINVMDADIPDYEKVKKVNKADQYW